MSIVTDGLVLYLHGACGKNNPATRVWKDLSGNGNDGELVNFGYTEDSGWVDGGLKFDGVDDYVTLGNNPDLKPDIFSIELFLRLIDHGDRHCIFTTWPGYTIELNRQESRLGVAFGLKAPYLVTSSNIFEFGQLIHIVCVYDGQTQYIYVDGEFLAQKDEILNYSDANVVISDSYRRFKGKIYSVKFYNRALTDEEILQNYQAGHEWTPQIGKRKVTTTMKPITTSLSRKGKGKRELISTMKPITTSLERKGKGTREVISTMKPITASLSRKGVGKREVTTTVKPITASLSRKGVGKREVTTTVKPITSSISKKLPPIHVDMDIRERIPKLEVD